MTLLCQWAVKFSWCATARRSLEAVLFLILAVPSPPPEDTSKATAATRIQAQARRRAATNRVDGLRLKRAEASKRAHDIDAELSAAKQALAVAVADDDADAARATAAVRIQSQARRKAAESRVSKLKADQAAAVKEGARFDAALQNEVEYGQEAMVIAEPAGDNSAPSAPRAHAAESNEHVCDNVMVFSGL